MSDYQDLCEMYGTDAGDPDFLDWLIDGFSEANKEYKEVEYYQHNSKIPAGRLVHMIKLEVCHPAKPVAAKFNFVIPVTINLASANYLKSSNTGEPASWFVNNGFTVRSMKERGYWFQLAYKATNEMTKLSSELISEYCEMARLS